MIIYPIKFPTYLQKFWHELKNLPNRIINYYTSKNNESRDIIINDLAKRVITLEQENISLATQLKHIQEENQENVDELRQEFEEFEISSNQISGLDGEIEYGVENYLENNLYDLVKNEVGELDVESIIKDTVSNSISNHDLIDIEEVVDEVTKCIIDKLQR